MSSTEWQLREGRISASEAEHAAIDKLVADNPDAQVCFSRRDPGETGPLIVSVGEDVYEMADDGTTVKQDG